jgi:ABC-type transport system involved in multi-copper enzyme maturation permease subunit
MSTFMIKRLILKDWDLLRGTLLLYLAAGAVALGLVAQGSEGAFYAGSILTITILFALGIHIAMATVVVERTEQTLPFVMSLPISLGEYTTAKILANLLIFLIPWTAITIGTFAVLAGRTGFPAGLIPFSLLVLMETFASYALILAVALISESQGWTIAATVVGELSLQGIMYFASHEPAIAGTMKGNRIVWSPPAVHMLLGEVATILLLLGLTFFFQSRKTHFI